MGASLRKKKLILFELCRSCQYCGVLLSEDRATLDHLLPLSRGGTNKWSNLILSCKPCNSEKGARLLDPLTQPKPRIKKYPSHAIVTYVEKKYGLCTHGGFTKEMKHDFYGRPLKASIGQQLLHKSGGGAGSRTPVQKSLSKPSTRVSLDSGSKAATAINSPYLRERLITFCRASVTRCIYDPFRFIAEAIRRLWQLAALYGRS